MDVVGTLVTIALMLIFVSRVWPDRKPSARRMEKKSNKSMQRKRKELLAAKRAVEKALKKL